MKKIFIFLLLLCSFCVYAKDIPQMEFQNQKITDILIILSDIGECSIIPDETVQGNVTFYFKETPFEQGLNNFLSAFNLYASFENGIYYISKINIKFSENELLTIDAEDVDLTFLLKKISKKINKTILYDQLPKGTVSIHTVDTKISKVLEMLIRKSWDYELIEEEDYFYIQKLQVQQSTINKFARITIKENNSLFSIDAPKATFVDIIEQLFDKANKEYSNLTKTSTILENIYFENKEFDVVLRLILDLANADYVKKDDIYYIFETTKNEIIKKLKNTKEIKLKNISVQNALALLPTGYDVTSMIKIDKISNTFYITGSQDEIQPITDFITKIDKPIENKNFQRFDVNFGNVKDIIQLIPTEYFMDSPIIIPDTNSFITTVTTESASAIKSYLKLLDKNNKGIPIRLKYIKSEELLKFLPPSVSKEELVITRDDTLVFYTGSELKLEEFKKNLELIDIPKPQIRYELLIMQYQKSDNVNFSNSFSVVPTDKKDSSFSFSGMLSNLLNINFDIVSQFGYQFALNLNNEIGENKAKVLADTTLHGISGTDVKFQNTNTFRYNEGVMDDSSSVVVKTTTKEITSGLQLNINGWVSGDGMITMKVNAEVSKQGTVSDSSNSLPPTSEKLVTSEVRTKSGSPIIIGGLLQTETTETIKKIPLLWRIPLLGNLFQKINSSEEITEMVIYIVPHVYFQEAEPVTVTKNIEKYYSLYVTEN
ncbi:MAG: hypothetical protein IJD23_01325 [Spirochaetaceae bacterium]|nr:hypothetical protein [Spirochaetaceae bacterium]